MATREKCEHKEIAMAREWKAETKAHIWGRSGCKCLVLNISHKTLVVTYYCKFETEGRLENSIKCKVLMLADPSQICMYQIVKVQIATKYREIGKQRQLKRNLREPCVQ